MRLPHRRRRALRGAPTIRRRAARAARVFLIVAPALLAATPVPLVAATPALLLAAAAGPAETARWRWTPEVIVDMTRLADPALSPDGGWVVYSASRPRPADAPPGPFYANLYLVPAQGGAARRLTSADAADASPAWSSDGRLIGFLSARGGEKAKTRLWVMPADGGEPQAISPERSDVEAFAWSPAAAAPAGGKAGARVANAFGARVAWIAVDPKSEAKEKEEKAGRDWTVEGRDERPRRLWVATIGAGGIAPAAPDGGAAGGTTGGGAGDAKPVAALGERSAWQIAWSPDGQAIVATVTDTPRTDDSYVGKSLVVLPLDPGGRARTLVGVVGKVDQVVWSKDGGTIAWRGGVDASDPKSQSLFVVPAAGGAPKNLTGSRPESVESIVWAKDRTIVTEVNEGTAMRLVSQELGAAGARRVLYGPGPPTIESATASADGARFAFAGSSGAAPPEAFVLGAKGGAPRRVTDLNPAVAGLPKGTQETVRWQAGDGQSIEGVLMHPSGDAERASYPLVVIVHGGPEYAVTDEWLTRYAEPAEALAERGVFVLWPNYRGSTGRGVAFSKGDHGDLGGREFQDVLDGIDALAPRYRIDTTRVGMLGGSYGGYFTDLAVTRYSDRFAAGASLFGISDWLSFLGESDIPKENSLVHWDLWCYDHQQACAAGSPVSHVGKARTPTLILQGEADARVPRAQSDELYAALKWKGVPVEYVRFPREKHGFVERAHRIETARLVLDWFETHLKP